MSTEFQTFLLGAFIHVMLSVIIMILVNVIFPFDMNILEAWGFMMLLVLVHSGWGMYHGKE